LKERRKESKCKESKKKESNKMSSKHKLIKFLLNKQKQLIKENWNLKEEIKKEESLW